MQNSRMPLSEDISIVVPHKKNVSTPKQSVFHSPGNGVHGLRAMPSSMGKKAPKRNLMNDGSHLSHQSKRSNSDSLPDSSSSGNEYRALRRKYLLLEEESFGLERDLKEVEGEVKTLEDEKLALLDQLVVLEGLMDPSESPL